MRFNCKQLHFFISIALLFFSANITQAQEIKSTEQKVISPNGIDTRIRTPNPYIADQYPFRTVVKLFVTFPKATVQGTGVLVSADGVFTAAHVVFDQRLGGLATKVEIVPGFNGGNKPFGSTYNSRIEVPDEYIKTKDKNYDFAAILTTTPIGNKSGWLGYIVPPGNLNQVLIIGYPDSYDNGTVMVQTTSDARLSNKNEIQYKADTSTGMSGAPIIIKLGPNDRDYRVIGVHTRGGDKLENSNFGVRFLDEFLRKF